MRIALITDIHEDAEKLEKALYLLEIDGYDKLICLGDITGYSKGFNMHQADALKCIELLKDRSADCVIGNHDLNNCRRLPSYSRRIGIKDWYQLDPALRKKQYQNRFWLYEDEQAAVLHHAESAFLNSLPESLVVETKEVKIMISHFLEPDICGISTRFPASFIGWSRHLSLMDKMNCKLAFVGHAHPPGVAVNGLFWWRNPSTKPFSVPGGKRIVICPPLVSNSQNPSSCIIFDSSKYEINTIFVP